MWLLIRIHEFSVLHCMIFPCDWPIAHVTGVACFSGLAIIQLASFVYGAMKYYSVVRLISASLCERFIPALAEGIERELRAVAAIL